jgi:hypothetical protein
MHVYVHFLLELPRIASLNTASDWRTRVRVISCGSLHPEVTRPCLTEMRQTSSQQLYSLRLPNASPGSDKLSTNLGITAKFTVINRAPFIIWRPQWPRLARHVKAVDLLRGLRIRVPQVAWMSVSCECCVLSGTGHCVRPITRPEESYRMWCGWVWSWSLDADETLAF